MTFAEVAARQNEFRAKMHEVLADLEATLVDQDYFLGLLTYADLCVFGSLKWVTVVGQEPLFGSTPTLRAWWERIQKRLGI
jgi:glutathione S-transferase